MIAVQIRHPLTGIGYWVPEKCPSCGQRLEPQAHYLNYPCQHFITWEQAAAWSEEFLRGKRGPAGPSKPTVYYGGNCTGCGCHYPHAEITDKATFKCWACRNGWV